MFFDGVLKSDRLPVCGNDSLLTGDAVHINPQTGELADPTCAAAKYWMPRYEPGWDPRA